MPDGHIFAFGSITKDVTTATAEGNIFYVNTTIDISDFGFTTTPYFCVQCMMPSGFGAYYTAGTSSATSISGWLFFDVKSVNRTCTIYIWAMST